MTTLTTHKIRRELATLTFTTAHARTVKNDTIAYLLTYERSVSAGGEIDFPALYAVCQHIQWLSDHVREIDDKRVLPSQRLFLADAFAFCTRTYDEQGGI